MLSVVERGSVTEWELGTCVEPDASPIERKQQEQMIEIKSSRMALCFAHLPDSTTVELLFFCRKSGTATVRVNSDFYLRLQCNDRFSAIKMQENRK